MTLTMRSKSVDTLLEFATPTISVTLSVEGFGLIVKPVINGVALQIEFIN